MYPHLDRTEPGVPPELAEAEPAGDEEEAYPADPPPARYHHKKKSDTMVSCSCYVVYPRIPRIVMEAMLSLRKEEPLAQKNQKTSGQGNNYVLHMAFQGGLVL